MIFGQEAVQALDQEWLHRVARDTSNRVVGEGPSPYLRAVFVQKGLLVSTAIGQRITHLVASDNPVLKAIPKGMHLLDEGSEISMPISKDTVLTIIGRRGVQFNPGLDIRSVRHINEGTFFQSREVACSSKKVLESLIRADRKNKLYMQE